jgi:hypothetical protein
VVIVRFIAKIVIQNVNSRCCFIASGHLVYNRF